MGTNTIYTRVFRNNNLITISDLNDYKCGNEFLYHIYDGIKRGFADFEVFFDCDVVFPNAIVPIVCYMDYYKNQENIAFNCTFSENCKKVFTNHDIVEPFVFEKGKAVGSFQPFNNILRFENSSQVATITQAFVDELSRLTICQNGILNGLIWCISETMDNVLTHSEIGYGFVMGQFHPTNNHIAFCINDSGIGIYNSLKNSKHKPRKPSDAISLAIQEGIGDGKGQGNGLYGLHQIVTTTNGSLSIKSGSELFYFTCERQGIISKQRYPKPENHTTTIDFQLNLNNELDLPMVLGEIPLDLRLDNMLTEEDWLHYVVLNNCDGTATRDAGARMRNDVINSLLRNQKGIVLDFAGITIVSSSFIDEFIAKLLVKLGPVSFINNVKIQNMNDTIKYLCERSIYMRIHDEWANKP